MEDNVRAYCWIGLTLSIIARVAPAAAVSLQVTSASVSNPGDTTEVCVVLTTDGAAVAGTQNDLTWDGSCSTLSSAGDCRVNPAIGKELAGALPGTADFTYRAVVLSLTDVSALPDGPLYCCSIAVEARPGSCCPIAITHALASDPSGISALPVFGNVAQLCVADSPLTPTPTPTATPRRVLSDSSGCQISPRSSIAAPLCAVGAVLALLARRRSGRRRCRPPVLAR